MPCPRNYDQDAVGNLNLFNHLSIGFLYGHLCISVRIKMLLFNGRLDITVYNIQRKKTTTLKTIHQVTF